MLDSMIIPYKVILIFIITILISILFYRIYCKNRFALKTRRQVRRISYDFMQNVTLDNGVDQYAQYDYLALTQQGILIIESKNYAGHIFAAEKIDEWTQIIDRKSYKFTNPFFELDRKVELLRSLNKELKIDGLILFTDEADFPKGCPEKIINLKNLKDEYCKLSKQDLPAGFKKSWDDVKEKIQVEV